MLRWEEQKSGGWYAYSGDLIVGMVVQISVGESKGLWTYDLSAVHWKWTCKGHGDVKTAHYARQSLARAWEQWCIRASLQPKI